MYRITLILLTPVKRMGYRFQLVRLSVRLSVTIYPTHFVDTTSTLPSGPIETGPVLYESQDIEPWPR